MKVICVAAAGIIISACCLGGSVSVFGQEDGSDIGVADVKARIEGERGAILELRRRQENAEREKTLLTAEIESETRRISKLSRTIELTASSAKPAKRPVVRRRKEGASAAVPSHPSPVPALGARLPDAESQAEIDRLSTMKKDLISEKDMLEQVVKKGY